VPKFILGQRKRPFSDFRIRIVMGRTVAVEAAICTVSSFGDGICWKRGGDEEGRRGEGHQCVGICWGVAFVIEAADYTYRYARKSVACMF